MLKTRGDSRFCARRRDEEAMATLSFRYESRWKNSRQWADLRVTHMQTGFGSTLTNWAAALLYAPYSSEEARISVTSGAACKTSQVGWRRKGLWILSKQLPEVVAANNAVRCVGRRLHSRMVSGALTSCSHYQITEHFDAANEHWSQGERTGRVGMSSNKEVRKACTVLYRH